MNDAVKKINEAPTHLVYLTKGHTSLITQTMGTVTHEDDEKVVIESCFGGAITVNKADLFGRKDDGGRVSPEEMDAIFAEHGHKQGRK